VPREPHAGAQSQVREHSSLPLPVINLIHPPQELEHTPLHHQVAECDTQCYKLEGVLAVIHFGASSDYFMIELLLVRSLPELKQARWQQMLKSEYDNLQDIHRIFMNARLALCK
jgi:hypothetical protein